MLASVKESGINPYPHKFFVSMSIVEYVDKYRSLENGEHLENVVISLAGIQCLQNVISVYVLLNVLFTYLLLF